MKAAVKMWQEEVHAFKEFILSNLTMVDEPGHTEGVELLVEEFNSLENRVS